MIPDGYSAQGPRWVLLGARSNLIFTIFLSPYIVQCLNIDRFINVSGTSVCCQRDRKQVLQRWEYDKNMPAHVSLSFSLIEIHKRLIVIPCVYTQRNNYRRVNYLLVDICNLTVSAISETHKFQIYLQFFLKAWHDEPAITYTIRKGIFTSGQRLYS